MNSEELDEIRRQIWGLYEALKAFSEDPSDEKSSQLTSMFDKIFDRSGIIDGCDELLKHTYSRKKGLLQELSHLRVLLHNNDCARDIREYIKRRKISGTTRSAVGRRVRDTLLSLDKICSKLQISFFGYLRDRRCALD